MVSEKKVAFLLFLVCCWGKLPAQNDSVFSNNKLSSCKLYNVVAGKNVFVSTENANSRLSLFIFLSPECPLSQNYLPLFNSLKEKYTNDISFYGIIPGKAYSPKVVRDFASTYNIQYPLLIDSLKSLSKYLQATVTPEVVLINNKNMLVYKGAVDDLLTDLGKRRVKTTSEYLKNAIAQSLENKTAFVKRTKAAGCKINDY